MKISIIIPYHAGEAFLRDCLDSLKEQSYQDKEVLLICDRVKEKSLLFLSDYQPELTINVYHLKDKKGVAAARNLGLEKASGDYVYFIDSDDYLYGNTLENLITAAQDRDDDIVYGRKKPTWFQRSVFLVRKQELDSDDVEEENENNAAESAELNIENGGDDDKDSSSEEDEVEDVSEEKENKEGMKEAKTSDAKEAIDLINAEDEAEGTDLVLTEEEQIQLKQARIRQAYRILVTKRKGVRNISVLNILFKRSFIEEHKLRFPEDLKYFSDVPFLLEALSKTERYKKRLSAKYIKRNHNDAIHFPSLSQIKDPNRFDEFISAYYETMKRIPKNSELKNCFDSKYVSYFTKTFAPKMKRSKNNAWRTDRFIKMSEIMEQVNPEVIRKLKGYSRSIIKSLMKKDVKKTIRIATRHLGYRKLNQILKNKRILAKTLYYHLFLKLPMADNFVLFESFLGKNYSDSPKFIYEYLSKNYPGKYKFIWITEKKKTNIPYKHKTVRRFGIRYAYYLARCKYYVFNGRQPEWIVKREGNVFLQTWHGTPLKKLVFDIDDVSSATPKYKQQFYKQSRAWDYLIAPNEFSSETFRRCFMYEKTMLETGYPRNDILHAPNRDEITDRIKRRLKLPEGKKIILYAPTWRDDEFYDKGQYKFELRLDLELMRQQIGEDYIILLRTHYFIADSLDVSGLKGFAYNLSKYDDISELYLISDILITDYSSVFFDYANLKRPMLFFTYDLEKYRDILRGFYIDIEKEVPGPLLFTTEEIITAVKNIGQIKQQYEQRYNNFYSRFCEWEDGHASEKVVKSVFGK